MLQIQKKYFTFEKFLDSSLVLMFLFYENLLCVKMYTC